jgi:hypothetical protein
MPLGFLTEESSQIAQWIGFNKIRVLNVAGNRESKAPRIGLRAELFLGIVFKMLGKTSAEGQAP